MPYPQEHACRINNPDKYDKFNRKNCDQKHDDKCIDVIYGIKDGKSEIQALRYPKDIWTASAARSHCKTRDGTFEAAAESSQEKQIDRRALNFEEAEIRAMENDAGQMKITGYFALFNKLSVNLGGFREKIAPGAFKESLKNSDVVDLFNHDPNFILGRESAGTLRVWEDQKGLAYEVDIPDTQLIKDLVISPIKRKELKGNSFGFFMPWDKEGYDEWGKDEDGLPIRTIRKIEELIDGSQVTFPAYPQTNLALRSKQRWEEGQKGLGENVKPLLSSKLNEAGTQDPKTYDPIKKRQEWLNEFRSFFG